MSRPAGTVIQANAKINLFLHIVGKRPDGYHLLESLFAFTSSDLSDAIEIISAEQLSVNFVNFPEIDKVNNTIHKAVKLLCKHVGKPCKFSIKVKKIIPVAAGIGGGSADAAAVLRYLCTLWNIEVNQEIYNIALEVGADVPACLYNKASFVTGIGEHITPMPKFLPLIAILVTPVIPVSTRQIFKNFSGKFTKSCTKSFETEELFNTVVNCKNDLQDVAESLYPEISHVVYSIKVQDDCIFSRMSGSGPTCFGIFNTQESANKALKNLKKEFSWVKLTTLS